MTPSPSQHDPEANNDCSLIIETEETPSPVLPADDPMMAIGTEDVEIEAEVPLLPENELTITSLSSTSSSGTSDMSEVLSTALLLEDDDDIGNPNLKPSILASITIHPLPPSDEKHIQINLPPLPGSEPRRTVWPQVCLTLMVKR